MHKNEHLNFLKMRNSELSTRCCLELCEHISNSDLIVQIVLQIQTSIKKKSVIQ